MTKFITTSFFFFVLHTIFAQSNPLAAFQYKLDYNVPQSPAFSVLGANPTTVMRATAPQEMIVNMASNFIGGNKADPGFAIDFNPYFNFGGRLQSSEEFRRKYFKRLLANAQMSLATVDSRMFPTDLMIGSGLRITLFDSKDNLNDKELAADIDRILLSAIQAENDFNFGDEEQEDQIVVIPSLKDAYERGKARYRKKAGGALSLGTAFSARAQNRSFQSDSLQAVRSQVWLSGQFDFGENGFSINGMLMYQNDRFNLENEGGLIAGLAMRHYGEKSIFLGEIIYDDILQGIEFTAYTELYLIPQITITVSLGYQIDEFTMQDGLVIKPGVKWNLSELGK